MWWSIWTIRSDHVGLGIRLNPEVLFYSGVPEQMCRGSHTRIHRLKPLDGFHPLLGQYLGKHIPLLLDASDRESEWKCITEREYRNAGLSRSSEWISSFSLQPWGLDSLTVQQIRMSHPDSHTQNRMMDCTKCKTWYCGLQRPWTKTSHGLSKYSALFANTIHSLFNACAPHTISHTQPCSFCLPSCVDKHSPAATNLWLILVILLGLRECTHRHKHIFPLTAINTHQVCIPSCLSFVKMRL